MIVLKRYFSTFFQSDPNSLKNTNVPNVATHVYQLGEFVVKTEKEKRSSLLETKNFEVLSKEKKVFTRRVRKFPQDCLVSRVNHPRQSRCAGHNGYRAASFALCRSFKKTSSDPKEFSGDLTLGRDQGRI